MLFRAILPTAGRTWARTQICWLLTNTFTFYQTGFVFSIFLYSRFEALIYQVVFQLGKQIKQNAKHKTRQKLLHFAKSWWYTLDSKSLSSCLSFVFFLHSKIIERIVSISYYHIFTSYSFLKLVQWDIYSFYFTISIAAKSNGYISIPILLNFSAAS